MRILCTFIVLATMSFNSWSQTDLSDLFSTPTQAEIDAVKADWAARDVQAYNWQIHGTGTIQNLDVEVVSHDTYGDENFTHYGFVRYPENYNPANSYPVLVKNHGGQSGTGPGILLGPECYKNFIMVSPSFRGEELRTDDLNLGTFLSEAEKSEFDGDIDDVLALLNGVLENVAGADPNRIAVLGGSRGGGVSYLMSIRDSRIERTVVNFGATDHMTFPGMKEAVESYIDNGGAINPPMNTALTFGAEPYLANEITLAEARLELLRRSVYYFTDLLPAPLQVHHGAMDFVVEVEHSQRLKAKMDALGIMAPDFEYFEYAEGAHGPGIDPDGLATDLICDILTISPVNEVVENTVLIAPNPAMDYVNISGIEGEYMLRVLDINGRELQVLNGQGSTGFDVSELSNGMYILAIESEAGRVFEKLIVNE